MKSIKTKIMTILGGIILLGLIVSGMFIIHITKDTVMTNESQIVSTSTDTIVGDINTYFQKYVAVVQQMSRLPIMQELLLTQADSGNVAASPYFNQIHGLLADSAAADPDGAASYFVGSALTDMAFNGVDWISEPGAFDLSKKSYGFNTVEDLDRGLIITEPYQDVITGAMVVTIAAPVRTADGQLLGVMGADLQITAVNEMVTQAKSTYKTGYQMLISNTDEVLAHKNKDAVLKSVADIGFDGAMIESIKNNEEEVVFFQDNGVPCYGVIRVADFTGWKVLSVIPEKEYLQTVTSTTKTMVGIYIACFVFLLMAIFAVAAGVVAPLKKLTKATNELATGNLHVELDMKSKDEVGKIADSMTVLVARLNTYILYIEEVSTALDEFGRGNLNIQLYQAYDGDFGKLKTSMLQTAEKFRKTIGELVQISDHVSNGSDQVASGAQMLAQGSTEQASSVEELSATIQEVSDNVNQNAMHAKDAAEQVQTVGKAADMSNEQMKNMIEAIRLIDEKSAEIGKIIKTIDDIAFQTNILALNAAVEAARAGEAGKGFAVVADEVRNLASKSAEAAKETTALIEDSIKAVANGTVIADETGKMLAEVLRGVTETVELINEISTASTTQAVTISQILQGVDQISSVVQTNSATAEESSAASEELAGQATLLKDVSDKFQL